MKNILLSLLLCSSMFASQPGLSKEQNTISETILELGQIVYEFEIEGGKYRILQLQIDAEGAPADTLTLYDEKNNLIISFLACKGVMGYSPEQNAQEDIFLKEGEVLSRYLAGGEKYTLRRLSVGDALAFAVHDIQGHLLFAALSPEGIMFPSSSPA